MSVVQRAFVVFLLALAAPAVAADTAYQRIPAAIHLHSTFSTGIYSVEDLIEIAHAAGVRVAIVTDHDTMRFDYGLPLMPWLTGRIGGRLVERPSILKLGADTYLSRLAEVGESYPDMVILPGVEAIPFFYWEGSPWGGDLTLRRGNEHILVIGLERPEGVRGPAVGGAPDVPLVPPGDDPEPVAAGPRLLRLSPLRGGPCPEALSHLGAGLLRRGGALPGPEPALPVSSV
ncbi:MAG: hypothetical protein EXS64_05580 [Candidatus Latescibacteria bacterium]|nr:hypothetical protein [Candidatus Latescibacterota bacterium]